jgi:pyridoxine 5-phosphate synthase
LDDFSPTTLVAHHGVVGFVARNDGQDNVQKGPSMTSASKNPSKIRRKIRLGVNVDHVATLRNARGGFAPDPLRAALAALKAGADGITAHLREDRRHINDEDMRRLKESIDAPLNFEMAATEQMLDIALKVQPNACCLVPEKRTERTTEGGLDVVGGEKYLIPFVNELSRAGIRVSLFIEPSFEALAAAKAIRAPVVELHTGAWCHAVEHGEKTKAEAEFARLRAAASEAARLGIECHAGHGLDFDTARTIAALPELVELNIGHFLIGEAIFIGLDASVRKMRAVIEEGVKAGAAA